LSRKANHNRIQKFSQGVEVAEATMKNFYAAGLDALVKRWDKSINVDVTVSSMRNLNGYSLCTHSSCNFAQAKRDTV
jgi:hypothetical protein